MLVLNRKPLAEFNLIYLFNSSLAAAAFLHDHSLVFEISHGQSNKD